jgi:HEPN domain-containing protein
MKINSLYRRIMPSVLSPLLSGAIEDLVHSLEHAENGSEKDNKYAVIHAATAIELVLKEKVRSTGVSIFHDKPPYNSLDYYDCLRVLHGRNITVPLEADIELVHKERNNCIHQGSKPDKDKTMWSLSVTRQFMEQFCHDQLGFDIGRYLPVEVKTEILSQAERAHLNPAGIYLANAEFGMMENNYSDAIMNAEASIELLIRDYLESYGIKAKPVFHDLISLIQKEGKLPKHVLDTINDLHDLRNSITHFQTTANKDMARRSVTLAGMVFDWLQDRWKREKRCVICGSLEVVGTEKSLTIKMTEIKSKRDFEKAMEKENGEIVGYFCKKHEPYWATH